MFSWKKLGLTELLATSVGVAYGFLVGFYHGNVNCIRNTFPGRFYKVRIQRENLEHFRDISPDFHIQSVKGKVVVITGGGGGLGRLMSLKLADLGAVVVSLDINEEGNMETKA